MTTYTAQARIPLPGPGDPNWGSVLLAAFGRLDAAPGVGPLCVRPAEEPSASLGIRIAAGTFRNSSGVPVDFAARSATVPASATTRYWVDDAGGLGSGPDWPDVPCLRLATVAADVASVAVQDARIGLSATLPAPEAACLPLAGGTVSGTLAVAAGAGGSTFLVDPVADAVGFFGHAPMTQAPGGATLVDATTGLGGATLVDVGSAPSQAAINNNFASLAAAVAMLSAALKRYGLTT